jgi:hypothetical protein
MTELEVTPAAEAEAEETETRTVAELQDELRDRGLPVSGTKDELIGRLADDDAATEDKAADEASSVEPVTEPVSGPGGTEPVLAPVVAATQVFASSARMRASEATDPAVHQLLANRQAHQMNLDALRPPENDEAIRAAEAEIRAIDEKLAKMGYE